MVNISFTFCAFFPSFISNTSIVSINFRANLDAQNAGKCISGLQISKMFWGSMPPEPPRDSCVVCRSHGYPPLIYYLTERSLFKKCPPPHGKILKKGPDKISNKVVFVYYVSKVVGQTNTVPLPNKIRLIRPWVLQMLSSLASHHQTDVTSFDQFLKLILF